MNPTINIINTTEFDALRNIVNFTAEFQCEGSEVVTLLEFTIFVGKDITDVASYLTVYANQQAIEFCALPIELQLELNQAGTSLARIKTS